MKLSLENNRILWGIFLIICLAFILVKIPNSGYSISDENPYFYMGSLVAHGELPYRDFFFAHPPMHILVNSITFIFGFQFWMLKAIPLIATLITASFLFRLVKKTDNFSAILTVLLFLFSYDVLRASTYSVGVNLAAMFFVIGTYYLFEKKYYISGLLFGFAAATRYYSIVLVAIVMAFMFMKNRKNTINIIYGFLTVFGTTVLLSLIVGEKEFIIQTIAYHFMKPSSTNKIEFILRILKDNWLIFSGLGLSFFFRKKKFNFLLYSAIGYLVFLTLFQKVFGFYLVMIFPLIAILGGIAFSSIIRKINYDQKTVSILLIIVMIGISIFYCNKFIENKFQNFGDAKEITQYVTEITDEDGFIFGDDSTTGLIALLSDRKIALNYADSNNLRFRSGIDDIDEVIDDLEKIENMTIIIYQINIGGSTGRYGPAYMDEFYEYVQSCNVPRKFSEDFQGVSKEFLIFQC